VVFLDPTPVGSNAADLMQYAMSRAGVSVLAEGLRKELDGVRITMLRLRERSASCSAEFDPEDIADLVMGAIETPRHLELSELTVTLQSQAG
jgi:NADP-dependent 3-hydroxy acid dehydrogenase YdfG